MKKLNNSKKQKGDTLTDSKQKISPLEIEIANELQIVRFLDNITEDPLLYLYDKAIPQFERKIENFIESSKPELKEIWNENKKNLENIIKSSEKIAKQNRISRSYQKDSFIWSIPIFIAVIGVSFSFYYFVPQELLYYFIFIPFIFLCISNSLVSKLLMKKRTKFRLEKTPILKEQVQDPLIQIRNFNQLIINDIKNIIKENNFEPSKFKTYLYNTDYENIKVLETKEQLKFSIHLIGINVGE